MRITAATALFIILSPWAIGCGTAPNVPDDGGTPCSASSCPDEAPPESVCLEHLAADILDDGCGVFVAGIAGSGDDANPGTKAKPIFSVQYAIDLARRGRGRVFICSDGFAGNVRLPSGVDLFGGFNCWHWGRANSGKVSTLQVITNSDPLIIVEPASSSDTGAADGVSTIANIRMRSNGPISMLIQSGTVVEILRSEIFASNAWGGRDGEEWPWPNQASAGPDGQYGGHACSAATVPGGAAAVNRCDGGMPSISGKGGDGLPDGAEDGETGSPVPASDPTNTGRGGRAEQDNLGCDQGSPGSAGALGTVGAIGEGIGRISETGWEGGKAGDGGRGMPGQGGGGGGGQRGGFALCGVATKGGAGGGSGGAGGCGGRGGRGGENGYPTIGIVALHAKVTVRDSLITSLEAGPGGDGGPPEDGGEGGRGAPGGSFGDGMWSCQGANGGTGGPGGYGGPGRGGDSIGIAYLDEDQLKLEGVTYELGPPGKGGTSWDWSDEMVTGQDGNKVETLRFPE
ncbi:hypothetical protein WME75_32845 [Sorangium sp. So ce1014]|uniref:hypothetical protein n=1 Tax=Sorangium sp. So ce1014 TaxID=3133326 RepID=UPI003F646374